MLVHLSDLLYPEHQEEGGGGVPDHRPHSYQVRDIGKQWRAAAAGYCKYCLMSLSLSYKKIFWQKNNFLN